MALTASQTRNLNPDEQAGGMSSPGTLLTQGGPGFVGGGVTQSTPYSPGGGEATRSGMFTNIQDYLKANEGAAAPIVSKFEEKAQGVASPVGKMAEQTQTSLSGLKSNIETAKSGLESSLASQGELKGILEKARSTPSALSTAEIGKFRTGVGSYATPDVTSSIQSFVPQKEKAASSVADLIASANKAKSELQPLGEISGVKGLIRQFNPNERITAGGSSLDAFITRQAPEYEQFTQDLGTKISGIESAKTSVNPLFSDIEKYLGTGEGSLANIGSKFDPGYATGGKFQTEADLLRSGAEYSPSREAIIKRGLEKAGLTVQDISAQREAAGKEKSNQQTQQDRNRIKEIDRRIQYLNNVGYSPSDPGSANINPYQDEIDALINEKNSLSSKTTSTAEQEKLNKYLSSYGSSIGGLSRSEFMTPEQQARYNYLAQLSGKQASDISSYLGGLGLSSTEYGI